MDFFPPHNFSSARTEGRREMWEHLKAFLYPLYIPPFNIDIISLFFHSSSPLALRFVRFFFFMSTFAHPIRPNFICPQLFKQICFVCFPHLSTRTNKNWFRGQHTDDTRIREQKQQWKKKLHKKKLFIIHNKEWNLCPLLQID